MQGKKRIFKKNYLVIVYDMYDYGSSYEHTDYYTYDEAICVAKNIILSSFTKKGKDGYDEWMTFGEDAAVISINGAPNMPEFSGQSFVREACGLSNEET